MGVGDQTQHVLGRLPVTLGPGLLEPLVGKTVQARILVYPKPLSTLQTQRRHGLALCGLLQHLGPAPEPHGAPL